MYQIGLSVLIVLNETQMVQDDTGWFEMVLGGYQVVPGGTRWCQVVPGGTRWCYHLISLWSSATSISDGIFNNKTTIFSSVFFIYLAFIM